VRESLGSACKETEKGYLMDIQNIITFFSLLVNVLAIITFYITVRKYRDENKKGEMIGDYYVTGSILHCYTSFHGKVHLGKPQTEEYRASPSPAPYHTQGFVQRFVGYGDDVEFEHRGRKFRGISIYKSRRGTYAVYGNIGQTYEDQGGTGSRLGFPVSNEKYKNGEATQYFEGGRIYGDKRIEYNR
jgi:hypothetical protein